MALEMVIPKINLVFVIENNIIRISLNKSKLHKYLVNYGTDVNFNLKMKEKNM